MAEHDAVPLDVRLECYERDAGCCRVCGRYADPRGLHHVEYKSLGGQNVVGNLITIGWTPGHDCHQKVHANGRLWTPVLQQVLLTPGVNGLQLLRWARKREELT